MIRASASLAPMLCEEIYLGLHGNRRDAKSSVHLTQFPDVSSISVEGALVTQMDQVLDICNAALFIRSSQNIRVRQPLGSLKIVSQGSLHLAEFSEIIKDEVNVKEIVFEDQIGDYATFKLALNFQNLAKRLPNKVKDILAASKQGQWTKEQDGSLIIAGERLNNDEFSLKLEPKGLDNAKTLNHTDCIVILDTAISSDLASEGLARDLVRFIQQSRKDAALDVSDHINLHITTNQLPLQQAIQMYQDFIGEQTLSNIVSKLDDGYAAHSEELSCNLIISKISQQ
jgi:isoleucyl-tRNA synthetase